MSERCRHWRDIWHVDQPKLMAERCCAAGVVYCQLAAASRPSEPGWNLRLPCTGTTGPKVRVCPEFVAATPEEQEATRNRLAQIMEKLPALLETAHARLKADGPGQYSCPCPVCGVGAEPIIAGLYTDQSGAQTLGIVTFQVDWRDRRHTQSFSRGSCSTTGCVQWMT